MSTDLTTPSFAQVYFFDSCHLVMRSFHIVINQPHQVSNMNIGLRFVPLGSDIVLWEIITNPFFPNHISIGLTRSEHFPMIGINFGIGNKGYTNIRSPQYKMIRRKKTHLSLNDFLKLPSLLSCNF